MIKTKNICVFFISVLFSLSILNAESFRVRKAHITRIDNPAAEIPPVECNIFDAVGIYLPEDRTFLEGIEIKMVIPEEIAAWRNSVAATVYDRISPEPTKNQIDYSGTRLYVNALPAKLSWVLQIPMVKNHSIRENSYSSLIDTIPSPQATNIFVKFQPIMKGIPEEVSNATILVSSKPVFMNKGRLKLNLFSETENKNCSVFIDDISTDISKDIILDTGKHNISIVSENFRNEVRTFYIEQAKTTTIDIELKGVDPTLIISSPEGVTITLDDADCTDRIGKEFIITEGEHTIRFQLGNYVVVRSLNAIKGKTYKASLDVDLSISDSPDNE